MWGSDNMIDSCYFNNIDYSVADNSSIMLTIRMNGSDNTFSHNTIHGIGASATVKVGNQDWSSTTTFMIPVICKAMDR